MSNVFNVNHLVSYIGDSSDEDANLRENSLQPEEGDADKFANNFIEKFERERECDRSKA
jgi:hypothetical protein